MKFTESVAGRLSMAFALVALVFIIAVAASIGRLTSYHSAMGEVTGPELANYESAVAWADALSESMRHARNMLIMDVKSDIAVEIKKLAALQEKRQGYADQLKAGVQDEEGKALLQAALDAHDKLIPLDTQFVREVEADNVKAAREILLTSSRPAQLAVIASLKKLTAHEKSRIHARAASPWFSRC